MRPLECNVACVSVYVSLVLCWQELLVASPTPKTPALTVRLKSAGSGSEDDRTAVLDRVTRELEYRAVRDFVLDTRIVYDPNPPTTVIKVRDGCIVVLRLSRVDCVFMSIRLPVVCVRRRTASGPRVQWWA